MSRIRFGIDRLVAGEVELAKSAQVGFVTNDTARLAEDVNEKSRARLREAGFNLVRLFGPEHGIAASAEDGAAVIDSADPVTGLPVVSLYGQSHRPQRQHLDDLDAILFDIPDVGARFYTYIWTLSYVLEACAEAGKPLIVLDRPNPIGGQPSACEGPMLDEQRFSTFVGRWNIPVRHGLTVGELASTWNTDRRLGAQLRVVTVDGWRREMHWPDTRLPFVPTSPAMPAYETALMYPGTCLIEGTNLSEGRGTDDPFRLIGAPWVDANRLADRMNALELPGVRAEPATFTPAGRKYGQQQCCGVRLTATDPKQLRPVSLGLHLIAVVVQLYPDQFRWSPYPTAANQSGGGHFDRLVGTDEVRLSLQSDPSNPADRIARWTHAAEWSRRMQACLLYS